ncbi:MAG TPA: glycosyltransferase family 4 protein [Candidatus Limnocylindrales bacterium]|jgi:glycosyltransferase involved in cell wall biosynthesis|nr:glycosyltransferase family 4 protein [Candidatus Limnocylindrales bacterium]
MSPSLRIAQVAPPFERVPPLAYGGTERIVHGLVVELDRRGHAVTTFASGDSVIPGRHIETVPEALRPIGYAGDSLPYMQQTLHQVLAHATEFDVIHSHLEWISLLLARVSPVPVVSTFHGRLDLPYAQDLFADPPGGLVAISRNQAGTHPEVPWAAVVHNGLRLTDAPFGKRRTEALCFVGRVAPEKGIVEAIEIAQAAGRSLRIAAKVAPGGSEREYYDAVFKPALEAAGSSVEFLGELSQADRDQLLAESYAALMPGAWPEPFGLVAIEALACGTPLIARRIGALPEILREGIDGFFGDDVTGMAFTVDRVATLDREEIRASVLDRFSVERMTDAYEAVYRSVLAGGSADSLREGLARRDSVIPPERLATRRSDRIGSGIAGRS